jgi:hypothetical protein
MLVGKRFRLTRPTSGIQLSGGERDVVHIPADGVIRVLTGPNGNGKIHDKGIVYVLWEEQTVGLFAVDVETRGIEIKGPDDGYQPHQSASA